MKKILVAATGTFLLPSIDRLMAAGRISCLGVITQPARPVGRKQIPTPTAAALWAKERHIRIFEYSSITPHSDELLALGAEAMLIGDVGLIIPGHLLDAMPNQVINLHGSLLPRYRGATPIPQAILDGQTETGISWMLVEPTIDTGPVIRQQSIPIGASDDTPAVYDRLSKVAADSVVETLQGYWTGEIVPQPQDEAKATLTHVITREEGHAQWQDAELEERKTRAYRPWPGVWTMVNGQRLKILSATAELAESLNDRPGTIVAHEHACWAITCGNGLFIPTCVQREGKKSETPDVTRQAWPELIGAVAD